MNKSCTILNVYACEHYKVPLKTGKFSSKFPPYMLLIKLKIDKEVQLFMTLASTSAICN